ncbi:MAG: hypothetical protein CMJ49_01755 [Planctomycetaceae bacterium]|jgi:hypothetical protein|nr:hypothetical protein [Planctomycetaceae bacterium]
MHHTPSPAASGADHPKGSIVAKVGLLSDSHGRASTTRNAVRILLRRDVDVLIHLGDIGTVEVIDAMIERLDSAGRLSPPIHVVFGNTDWDIGPLGDYARRIGITVNHPVGSLAFDDKTLVFQHGHSQAAMDQALAEGATWLCHGHSHAIRDERIGPTRIINPGALFRASRYTVAVLDTHADAVDWLDVS